MELLARNRQGLLIRRVYDVPYSGISTSGNPRYRFDHQHNGIDAAAVPLPHGSEARLATQVPTTVRQLGLAVSPRERDGLPLQGDMAPLNSLHVEAYGRNRTRKETQGSAMPTCWAMEKVKAYSMVNSPPCGNAISFDRPCWRLEDDLRPGLAEGKSCRHFANRSWLCPSRWPCMSVNSYSSPCV